MFPLEEIPSTDSNCSECGLYKGCLSPCMPGSGASTQGCILVVGEVPGRVEDEKGETFVGKSGVFLRRELGRVGVLDEECRFVYGVRCRPKNGKLTSVKPVTFCRPHLLKEIEEYAPRAILLLGNKALTSVLKMSGITKYRCRVFSYMMSNGRTIPAIPCHHPASVQRNRNILGRFREDLEFFSKALVGEEVDLSEVPVNGGPTKNEIIELHKHAREVGFIVFDFETSSTTPYVSSPSAPYKVFCCSLSTGEKTIVLRLPDPRSSQALRAFLEDPLIDKIAHGANFDRHVALQCLGIRICGRLHDTLLMHSTLNPVEGGHDLDTVGIEYGVPTHKHMINEYVGKSGEKKDFGKIPYPILVRYCGLDAYKTAIVFMKMRSSLSHTRTNRGTSTQALMDSLVYPAQNALFQVERVGMHVNVPYLKSLSISLMGDYIAGLNRLKELPEVVKFEDTKRTELLDKINQRKRPPTKEALAKKLETVLFNPNSDKQVATILYSGDYFGASWDKSMKTPSGALSTKGAVLQRICEENSEDTDLQEFVSGVLSCCRLLTMRSTFVEGVTKFLDPSDTVHPSLNQGRARTGRLSCSKPNLQNVPIRGDAIDSSGVNRYRHMYVARPGCRIIEGDYSQVELKVMAAYSGDDGLLEIFTKGLDLHAETARKIFGITDSEIILKDQRTSAKAVNFGIIYCESDRGLAKNLGISREQAAHFIEVYFARFPKVLEWQDAQRAFVKLRGYVTTMFGRKRLLKTAQMNPKTREERRLVEEAYRQAVNTPVQGTASDISLVSLTRLVSEFKARKIRARVVCTVHDSILVEAEQADVSRALALMRTVMVREPARWIGELMRGIPIVVDFSIGGSWGTLKEIGDEDSA